MPLNIIIGLAIAIVLIILIIILFPSLLIFFRKVIDGKYSEKYIETYRKHTGENPYRTCIKGDLVNSIAGFYGTSSTTPVLKAEKPITFGTFKYGMSIPDLIKIKGNPELINANDLKMFYLKVFGYNDELFNFENKSFFYFADGIFFMGEYSVELTDDNKIEEISQILQQKYIGSIKTKSHNYLIEGSNNVIIYFYFNSTGFRLSIQYLNKSDPKINTLIDDYWHSRIRTNVNPDEVLKSQLSEKL